jgi:hypothetical protein
MPPQPNDILLAFKHIALSDQLNGTEKQFATFLVDSYNRRTGRCDPSEETAAHILRKHKRTIIRAGNRLSSLKLFSKRRHGGNNHCNHYQPNWGMFRELERAYKERRSEYARRFEHPTLSPSECQPRHSRDDNPVTQTSSNNNIPLTSPHLPSNQQRGSGDRGGLGNERKAGSGSRSSNPGAQGFKPSWSSQKAADAAALRRWNGDLLDRFRSTPVYAVIVEAVDQELQDAATAAELKRRGAGVDHILRELALRNVLP